MHTSRLLATVVLAAALGLTGCGGEEEKSISKTDFLEQGNSICSEGNAAIDAVGDTLDQNDPDAVLAAIKDQVVPLIQGQVDDLRDLGYPDGDKDSLEGLYADTEDVLASWTDDPSTALSDTSMDPINAGMTDYGLTECGN